MRRRQHSYRGSIAPVNAVKLSISLDAALADEIREAARAAGKPVSTWLAEAARAQLRSQALDEYLAEYEAEFGPFTAEELAHADRDLGFNPQPRADEAAAG